LVYPNPGNGQLTISSDTEINSVKIYNAEGQLVYGENNFLNGGIRQVNLTHVPKGMYYAYVMCPGKSDTKIIVIQK
jgi:hypothetical protein